MGISYAGLPDRIVGYDSDGAVAKWSYLHASQQGVLFALCHSYLGLSDWIIGYGIYRTGLSVSDKDYRMTGVSRIYSVILHPR